MKSTTLAITLIISGITAGGVNFFVNYLDLPFLRSPQPLTDEDWPKPKSLWLAILGYIVVGIAGAFLTPLINAIMGLKGYYPEKDFLVAFGYGLVFGYSTTKLLVSILDSLLKRISNMEDKQSIVERTIQASYHGDTNVDKALLITRPKWDDIYKGYPKTVDGQDDLPAQDVFVSILGPNYDRNKFKNACATRVSLALLTAKISVPRDFLISVGPFARKGFVASASKLQGYLSSDAYFGEADIIIENPSNLTEVQNLIGSKNGIYIMLGGLTDASGHSTLWLKDKKDVIGGHNYVNNRGTVYFWEIK